MDIKHNNIRSNIAACIIAGEVILIACGATLAGAQDGTGAQPTAASETAAPSAPGVSAQTQSDILVIGRPIEPPLPEADRRKDLFEKYLPYEQRVAGWVDNTARSIDRFFGTDNAWRVDNDSWLRVTNDVRWEQDNGVSNSLRPRLKLDLPTATERLHLLIENDSPEQRTAVEEAVPGLRNVDDRRTTVFGLGADFNSWLPEWKKQLQGGIRVALPLDPYARFIVRRDLPLSGEWEMNSYNRVAWFNRDGYSANSELKFGRPLSPKWRLYYTTDLTWQEKRDYLQFAETANLAHVLTNRSAITYTLGFSGTGFEGPQIDSYFLTADYRHNIARRIVFIDVIPEFSLPRDYGFDPHWAITFRLELYFQKQIEAVD